MKLEDLPFVCVTPAGRKMWAPPIQENETWADANQRGREMAASYLSYVEATCDVTSLSHIIQDMAHRRKPAVLGIETGFLSYIAAQAVA